MPKLKITSWNINSVRLRADRVKSFAVEHRPDILCLQEIKCQAAEFPTKAFNEVGLEHIAIAGQKGMHGVAIASRLPLEEIEAPDFCRHGHARIVAARINGVDVHNLYVPAGGDVPDPEENDKFAHKLDFLARMEAGYAARASGPSLIVVGDLNIAPEPQDVWSHKQLLDVVSHTPVETDGLKRVIDKGGFMDVARHAHDANQKLYTWWSYRARDWAKSNRGRRLDHIWANKAAAPSVDIESYRIHLAERGGEKPSDHAPISVELNV
ncbi:MAG: exodeoxyribonuclease III [Pseudomonadota bacterium]